VDASMGRIGTGTPAFQVGLHKVSHSMVYMLYNNKDNVNTHTYPVQCGDMLYADK
jgi:hypothetical protein